jgi:hypothetical protein
MLSMRPPAGPRLTSPRSPQWRFTVIVAVIDRAGHTLTADQPDLLTVLIRDWLDRVETAR